jgi:hypothetical protein
MNMAHILDEGVLSLSFLLEGAHKWRRRKTPSEE